MSDFAADVGILAAQPLKALVEADRFRPIGFPIALDVVDVEALVGRAVGQIELATLDIGRDRRDMRGAGRRRRLAVPI